jgi:hypothetical protein
VIVWMHACLCSLRLSRYSSQSISITRTDTAEGTRENRKIHRKEVVYGAVCVAMMGYM